MDFKNSEVLITGGSEGIGFELAKLFLLEGAKVLITGRSAEKLELAKSRLPGLLVFRNNIGEIAERELLSTHVKKIFPNLDVVINNAGIQRRIGLASDNASWQEREKEIHILFSAPIHLNSLLIPFLLKNSKPAKIIANVTSGGAYIPQVFAPVYSACKAALKSYTMILRHALSETNCRVVEIVPPAVNTALAGPGQNHGVDVKEFAAYVFQKLKDQTQTTIGFGSTLDVSTTLAGKPLEAYFNASSARFPVEKYKEN